MTQDAHTFARAVTGSGKWHVPMRSKQCDPIRKLDQVDGKMTPTWRLTKVVCRLVRQWNWDTTLVDTQAGM